MIVSFIKKFSSNFNYGPADAIDFFNPLIPLIEELEERELFDSTDSLINQAFAIYDDPSDQGICLEIIMQGVKDRKSEEEIMNNIQRELS